MAAKTKTTKISIPESLHGTKTTCNVESDDGLSFFWAFLAAKHRMEKNKTRKSQYVKFLPEIVSGHLAESRNMPLVAADIAAFERDNKCAVFVYLFDYEMTKAIPKEIHRGISGILCQVAYAASPMNEGEKFHFLAIPVNSGHHYIAITDMVGFFYPNTSRDSAIADCHVCSRCLLRTGSKKKWAKHVNLCGLEDAIVAAERRRAEAIAALKERRNIVAEVKPIEPLIISIPSGPKKNPRKPRASRVAAAAEVAAVVEAAAATEVAAEKPLVEAATEVAAVVEAAAATEVAAAAVTEVAAEKSVGMDVVRPITLVPAAAAAAAATEIAKARDDARLFAEKILTLSERMAEFEAKLKAAWELSRAAGELSRAAGELSRAAAQ